jgi:hypothetical protein
VFHQVNRSEMKDRRVEAYMVGPRVHANLMASHVFLDQHIGTFNDPGANDKESRHDRFLS